jgi:hypothetical protein
MVAMRAMTRRDVARGIVAFAAVASVAALLAARRGLRE